jgi:chromosome segregation ATPase
MADSMLEQGVARISDHLQTQCHDRLVSLSGQLTQEKNDFEAAASDIDVALAALEARVAQFEQHLAARGSEAVGQIEASSTQLDTLMTSVSAEVDTRLQGLDALDGEIEQTSTDLATSFDTTLAEVTAAAGELRSAFGTWTDAARKGFSDADNGLELLKQAADSFKAFCGRAAGDLVDRCLQVSQELESLRDGLVGDWTLAREHLEQGTQELLAGRVAQEFQGDIQRLLDVLAALRDGADRAANVLGGDASRLVQTFRQIGDLLAQIEPILRVVDELA